jgi:hypothetical protein
MPLLGHPRAMPNSVDQSPATGRFLSGRIIDAAVEFMPAVFLRCIAS